MKFQRKGEVQVNAGLLHKDADEPYMLKVEVKDQGPGMSEQESNHVFDATGGYESSAKQKLLNPMSNKIGLTICKQICKSLGGDIKVGSV